jgi:hypothetical protein
MKINICLIIWMCISINTQPLLYGPSATHDNADEVLFRGDIVAGNIQTALGAHLAEDPRFRLMKQLPEDRQNDPKMVVKKDGSFYFDWTPGQHARYLMEEIRQGVHELQSAEKPQGLDIVALAGGREYWPNYVTFPVVRPQKRATTT